MEDDAVLRSADISALELILRRDFALDIFADLAVDFAQFLGHVAGQILIHLNDLQLDFGDLAFYLRSLGDDLAALALKARFIALQRCQPVELHQIFLPQIAHALQFLLGQRDPLVLGRLLRGKAGHLLLQLGNALLQLLLLAKTVLVAQFKKLALARERLFDVRFVEAAGNLGRHRHGVRSVALGGEPRLARVKFNEAFVDDRQIGAGYGLIEAEENIAGFDMIAIAHEKFTDHAAGRMLHFLHIGIDDDRALRNQRARYLGRRCPAAQSDHEHTD